MYIYRNIYIYIHEYSRRTGAAAGVLRTAPSPPFWLRRVSETEAGSTCVDAQGRLTAPHFCMYVFLKTYISICVHSEESTHQRGRAMGFQHRLSCQKINRSYAHAHDPTWGIRGAKTQIRVFYSDAARFVNTVPLNMYACMS